MQIKIKQGNGKIACSTYIPKKANLIIQRFDKTIFFFCDSTLVLTTNRDTTEEAEQVYSKAISACMTNTDVILD